VTANLKPFPVSEAYIDWAHGSAAEEGQRLAVELVVWPTRGHGAARYKLFEQPAHVAEIADVAELYVGGRDTDLRAAAVHVRAVKWLRDRGLSVRQLVAEAHASEGSPLR
jgi:hypothetical protein